MAPVLGGLSAETSSAHSALPRPSLALRVKTDEKAKAADVRDAVMRSVPFHYGWVILMAGGIGAFMTLPGQTNGVALFFDPLAADLGLTRAQVALAYTVGTLAGILPAPLVGRWIDRRGPRLAAGAIAIAMGLACVVMALTSSALTLTIGFAAIRAQRLGRCRWSASTSSTCGSSPGAAWPRPPQASESRSAVSPFPR